MPRLTLPVAFVVLLMLGGGAWSVRAAPIPVRTQAFDIEYSTRPEAMPLDRVELWFTLDGGQLWTLFGTDSDRQSPVPFRAEFQGLHGFFVVLENGSGASSNRPESGTMPQFEAFVDFTPPVVQLHPATMTASLGQRVIQIRWTAIDAHFDPRPIHLEFQAAGTEWNATSAEPMANTGRFDWRVPQGLAGSLNLRAWAQDRAGNRTVSEVQAFVLEEVRPDAAAGDTPAVDTADQPAAETLLVGSARARQRVAELMARASVFQARGQFPEGIASLREAVRLDPASIDAFTRLGAMLILAGDPERAQEAFNLALKLNPRDRAALLGASLALRHQRDYQASAERIRTVLRYRPDDAEAWLALGDVAVFQGDELLARECYLRASRIDPNAVTIVEEAKQRLALMQETDRAVSTAAALRQVNAAGIDSGP